MKVPSGSVTSNDGAVPAVSGEPMISVANPVVESIEYSLILLELWLAIYRNCPVVDKATETGPVPVAKGDPETWIKAPFEAIDRIDTVSAVELATYTNLSLGSIANAKAPAPEAKGDPATGCKAPEDATEKAKTDPRLLLTTYRNFPDGVTASATGFGGSETGVPATKLSAPVPELTE